MYAFVPEQTVDILAFNIIIGFSVIVVN